jgi:hypothetical protein
MDAAAFSLAAAVYVAEVFEGDGEAGDYGDDEEHRENEDDDWEQHLDSGFGYGGFRAEAAALAEGVGVDFQGLREAGSETLALQDHGGEGLQVLNAGARIPESWLPAEG